MSRKKWILTVGSLAAALTLLVGGVVMAWGPGGFCRGAVPQMIVDHIDDRVERLNLSPEQEKQYQALRQRLIANLQASQARRLALFKEIKAGMDQPEPDVAALTGLVKQKVNDIPSIINQNLDLFVEFYGILNAEQKAKLVKDARKRMDRFQRYCQPG